MTPQTKIAVFKGIGLAVERFGDLENVARLFGVKLERLESVANDKTPVPPQWVDGLIAFGEGRISVDGFKSYRERYMRNHSVRVSTKGTVDGRPNYETLRRYKLIRIESKLRLLPPFTKLPHGAVFVDKICNRPVYLEGKLRENFLSEQIVEPHHLILVG